MSIDQTVDTCPCCGAKILIIGHFEDVALLMAELFVDDEEATDE